MYFADLGKGADRAMFHVDEAGNRERLTPEPRAYSSPRFSPDGSRLAVQISEESGSDVWIIDLARGTQSRITSVGNGILPVFSPSGDWLAFGATTPGVPNTEVHVGRTMNPALTGS